MDVHVCHAQSKGELRMLLYQQWSCFNTIYVTAMRTETIYVYMTHYSLDAVN